MSFIRDEPSAGEEGSLVCCRFKICNQLQVARLIWPIVHLKNLLISWLIHSHSYSTQHSRIWLFNTIQDISPLSPWSCGPVIQVYSQPAILQLRSPERFINAFSCLSIWFAGNRVTGSRSRREATEEGLGEGSPPSRPGCFRCAPRQEKRALSGALLKSLMKGAHASSVGDLDRQVSGLRLTVVPVFTSSLLLWYLISP